MIPKEVSDENRSRPQFFPHQYKATCDIFNCRRPAAYFVGRPDGPLSINMNLCEDCALAIIKLLPAELRMHVSQPEELAQVGDAYQVTRLERKSSEPKSIVCPDCKKQFESLADLKEHRRHCGGRVQNG